MGMRILAVDRGTGDHRGSAIAHPTLEDDIETEATVVDTAIGASRHQAVKT